MAPASGRTGEAVAAWGEEESNTLSLAPAAHCALVEEPSIGLPIAVAAAVCECVTEPLLQRPYVVGEPLTHGPAAYHSARRGACRVVYRIDDKAHAMHAVRIDHRADGYRS